MKKFLILLAIVFAFGICVNAKPVDFVVYVDVKNGVTRHAIDYLRCYVQVQDSIDGSWGLAQDAVAHYLSGTVTATFEQRPTPGKYRIYLRKMRTEREGGAGGYDNRYETGYALVDIPADAESGYKLPTFYIQLKRPREQELKEVTVTATKVMFYHKGDTLVYNADAFLLADGSMLDGLLNQMPGVELKPNGVIYCNGKRIQQLLLNGKDVFNGKFGEMLDNLPAYTIKDIAIYDKMGRVSEMMGMQTGDASHVMDVRLKREYSHGMMASADAGYGTKDRYLAKLFGLWFSDNVSVSANAGSNNLSDDSRAGEKDNVWSTSQMADGLFSTHFGGINYLAKGREDCWEVKGSADVSHKTTTLHQTSATEYFTTIDGMFTYVANNNLSKKFKLTTNHEFMRNFGKVGVIRIKPRFAYDSNNAIRQRLSASLRSPLSNWNRDTLNNLYEGSACTLDDVINRLKDEVTVNDDAYKAEIDASGWFKLKSSGMKNMLMLQLVANYSSGTTIEFNRYGVKYGNNSIANEFSHRYYKDSPDYNLNYIAKAEFTQYFRPWSLRLPIAYKYQYNESKKNALAYNLEQIDGYDVVNWQLDYYPYQTTIDAVLNPSQSYMTMERKHIHSLNVYLDNLSPIVLKHFPGRYIMFNLSGDLHLTNQTFQYVREKQTLLHRTDLTYDASLYTTLNSKLSNVWTYTLRLDAGSGAPNLSSIASLPNRDPLEINAGATTLKVSSHYGINISSNYKGTGAKSHSLHITARYLTAPTYINLVTDNLTGVQTLKHDNGKFRINAGFGYDFSIPLRMNSPFVINSSTSLDWRREILANMYSSGTLLEKVKLTWQRGNIRVAGFANARATLNDYSFLADNFKTLELKYGIEGLIKLPYGWNATTDVTLFTRRGFMNTAYNNTEFLWNLHASKSLFKGNLIIALDAYDVLHSVSHLTYRMDSQSRTEISRNGVPAYLLLHIRYQFRHNPGHH